MNARQRRSRRRLEERISMRAADRCRQKRPPQSQGEGAPVAKAATFAQAVRGPEAGEGISAFLQKRTAKWASRN